VPVIASLFALLLHGCIARSEMKVPASRAIHKRHGAVFSDTFDVPVQPYFVPLLAQSEQRLNGALHRF
jgi:hypothetical protein